MSPAKRCRTIGSPASPNTRTACTAFSSSFSLPGKSFMKRSVKSGKVTRLMSSPKERTLFLKASTRSRSG
ncbi:hypothetical protein [Gordoniibacillus kamchatkensis]|uniref:hypothetical protein n=1 Tax=Gordoniibacillus kamchatkensis TaxID=1590651 RepID=UPI001E34B9BC|nr:hypothetical protein [Paenibacillus sp. VKM B-2647]